MKLNRLVATVAIIGTALQSSPARAAEDPTSTEQLLQRIDELDQKVKALERKRELDGEAADEAARRAPVVSIGSSGFTFRSADTNFVLRLRGGVQTDGRFYLGDTPANDTFLLRRVRPIIEGTLFEKYDFRIMTDFASGVTQTTGNNGSILDAYVNARLRPWFQLQFGKFKEPVGLERLQSWNNLLFIERGFPTQLVPNRDTGVMLHGELFSGMVNYAVGAFNGTFDGGSSDFDASDPDKDVAARIFTHPFKNTDTPLSGLGLGVAGTYGSHDGTPRGYFSHTGQRFFAYRSGAATNAATANVVAGGNNWRVSPQGYYYWGPFGLFGEYAISSQELRRDEGGAPVRETLKNTAWQVAASCFLTGEDNSYKPVLPLKNFNPANGGWGALELTARVGELDVDDDSFPLFADPAVSATRAFSWGVGANWHLNRSVKATLNYEHTTFKGGSTGAATAQDENVILGRVQVFF
jgi:phosphate-selective porin OprO/OprP